jgi:hypothetical protein
MLDFSLNTYLTTLNLINKYKLRSVLEKPKLNSIELTLNLRKKNINNFEAIKIYIIFYLTFNKKPFLNVKSYNILENKTKNNSNTKTIKLSLNSFYFKSHCINNLLNSFPANTIEKPFSFKYVLNKNLNALKKIKIRNFTCESKISLNR